MEEGWKKGRWEVFVRPWYFESHCKVQSPLHHVKGYALYSHAFREHITKDVSGRAFVRPFPRDTWVFQTVFDDMNVVFRSSSSTTPSPVTTGTMHMAWSCSLLLYAMMQLDRVKNVHTTNHQSQTRKKALRTVRSGIQITHLSSGWACRLWLFESDM